MLIFLILAQLLCGRIQTIAHCHLYSIQSETELMGLYPNFNSRWIWAHYDLPTVRKQEARFHFQNSSVVPHTVYVCETLFHLSTQMKSVGFWILKYTFPSTYFSWNRNQLTTSHKANFMLSKRIFK